MFDSALFRLIFRESRRRLWWLIPLFAILALCFISSSLVPADLRLAWRGTAITQLAWGGVWWFALPAMLIEASRLGGAYRQREQFLFWKGVGLDAGEHLFSLAIPIVTLGTCSAFVACALSLCFGYRSMMGLEPWIVLHLQALVFFIIAALGLVTLTVGMAVRIGSAGALGIGIFILVVGRLLTDPLDELRIRALGSLRTELDVLAALLPQYRFADLTDRLVYQWGSLSPISFLALLVYHSGWTLFFIALVLRYFRPKKSPIGGNGTAG